MMLHASELQCLSLIVNYQLLYSFMRNFTIKIRPADKSRRSLKFQYYYKLLVLNVILFVLINILFFEYLKTNSEPEQV